MRRCRPLLGTLVEIEADGFAAIDAGFAAIAHVHGLMSAHERDSDVSRINRCAHRDAVKVHGWTARVIKRARFWSKRSGGAFDVVRAGRSAVACGLLPRHSDQAVARASRWTDLEIEGIVVRLLEPGCIDLGGIAKGFAVDRAVEAMRSAGAVRGLVNAGGDLFAFGPHPWPAVVVEPSSRRPAVEFAVSNEAIATSALIGGSSKHLGAKARWASVTVGAGSACDADALTKIVWADPPNLADLLDQARASAFGICADGRVESIARGVLAA